MADDEPSEQDIELIKRPLEQRENVRRWRNEQPYDGVLGRLPAWVPKPHQERFEDTRDRLLDSGAHNEPISADVVRGYLEIYTQLCEKRDSTVARADAPRDGPEWIPPEVMQDVGDLAHIRWAVSLGEKQGLRELAGKMAEKGAAHAEGYSKGGRASKKKKGIWIAVQRLVKANLTITAKEAWLYFPDTKPPYSHLEESVDHYNIYRDGEKLVQFNDKTGREVAIKYRSFTRYVSEAKRSK